MIVCPRLEIGNSSVTPCKTPSTIAWKSLMCSGGVPALAEAARSLAWVASMLAWTDRVGDALSMHQGYLSGAGTW